MLSFQDPGTVWSCSGSGMGAGIRGGSGLQELVPEWGRDTSRAQPLLGQASSWGWWDISVGAQWQQQGLVLAGTCPGGHRSAQGSSSGPWPRCHEAQGDVTPRSQQSQVTEQRCDTSLLSSPERTRLLFLTVTEPSSPLFNFHALNTEFWRHRCCTCFRRHPSTDADTQWPWNF